MRIFAESAMLPEGWRKSVAVTVTGGLIATVEADTTCLSTDHRVQALIPALSNLHSHTFQRGMAGMTEARGEARDSFWTWRELMYRFIDQLTPDDLEAIAAMAFVEMQESGFAAVAEFHYVHHQRCGASFDNPGELSERIFNAARQTGIGLTHLPVLYAFGGAAEKPLSGGQLRFGNDLDRYLALHESIRRAASDLPEDCSVGCAPHSLRAVNPDMLARVTALFAKGPLHIHIAEQTAEVDSIFAWLGARPVEWLLANLPVDENWCLIHATHMTGAELRGAAQTGAVAGLCPITEANLGDGIFEGAAWLQAGGRLGVGSDSNVRISSAQELAMLEYSQRLQHRERNVMAGGQGSTGEGLYRRALAGGVQALGRSSGAIMTGALADLASLDTDHPALCGLKPEQLLDGFVFGAPDGLVINLWSAGRHCVSNGQHVARDAVRRRFASVMRGLVSRL